MYQWRTCRLDPWVRKITWRRTWQPSPVFLPGEFHGQMSLEGYSDGVPKSWTRLSDSTHAYCILNHIRSIVSTGPPWRHSKDPAIAHVFNSDKELASQSVKSKRHPDCLMQTRGLSWRLPSMRGRQLPMPLATGSQSPVSLPSLPGCSWHCLTWWIFQTVFIWLKYKPKVLFSNLFLVDFS